MATAAARSPRLTGATSPRAIPLRKDSATSSSDSLLSSPPKGPPSAFSPFATSPKHQRPNPLKPSALSQSNVVTANNMAFNPIPTTPGKCSKLKINVLLDSTIYVAGGNLHGRMEVISSSSKSLRLGEISVELNGYEEVTDKDYGRSQGFLSARIVFQGERMPPSNAVRGPADGGYWLANKGKTTFPFAFRLPEDAPSSYAYQNLASLRYVITGVIQYQQNGKSDSLFRSKEAFVVENWKANHSMVVDRPIRARNRRKAWFGGSGEVQLEGTTQKSFFCSGNDVYVEVRVKNDSKCRVQGIKLSLVRKLMMLREGTTAEDPLNDVKIFSESVAESSFKEKDFIFDPGEERANILNVHIPRFMRTVRNTALAEVGCRVLISLNMGAFNKDLAIELPINICHSASILPPPTVDMQANMHPQHYNVISDDPADDVLHPSARRREQWKGTLRARSSSPKRTLRGIKKGTSSKATAARAAAAATNGGKLPEPKGRRALPWSDDEGDVADFVAKRRAAGLYDTAGHREDGRGTIIGADSPVPLRNVAPVSPVTAAARGIASKGNITKSPPSGPARPLSYIPATERSKFMSRNSQLLDLPSSPNQQTETPLSPQNWNLFANNNAGGGLDPLALPSPVLQAKRGRLDINLYSPPTPPQTSPLSTSPPSKQSPDYLPSSNRQARPLPALPSDAPSSPTHHKGSKPNERASRANGDCEEVPIQYRTISPPLKPRPAKYVSQRQQEPMSPPGSGPKSKKDDPTTSPHRRPGKTKKDPIRESIASAAEGVIPTRPSRFSLGSQVSTIVGTENNFLDIDFDFGDGLAAADNHEPMDAPPLPVLAAGKKKSRRAIPAEHRDAAAGQESPTRAQVKKSDPVPIASKLSTSGAGEVGLSTSPRGMSPRLMEYLAKYSQAANKI
ncbi:hypothetical protein DFS34DRAFT_276046 [Phlyctochytrium arcticum]|nr:hypothetical protein DFS34DRAFT_276046 [Phlyctochytrium arcticum]